MAKRQPRVQVLQLSFCTSPEQSVWFLQVDQAFPPKSILAHKSSCNSFRQTSSDLPHYSPLCRLQLCTGPHSGDLQPFLKHGHIKHSSKVISPYNKSAISFFIVISLMTLLSDIFKLLNITNSKFVSALCPFMFKNQANFKLQGLFKMHHYTTNGIVAAPYGAYLSTPLSTYCLF